MIVPLVVTLGSVAAGAALAGVISRDNIVLAALRTFAIAAVAAVVLVQILPESVESIGGAALVAFGSALVLPGLLGKVLRKLQREVAVETIGADLGYLGFAAHQLAEGLAIGTLTAASSHAFVHADLVLSMAAHTVPLTAVFVGAWLHSRGRKSAAMRTLGLLAASATGFLLAGSVQQAAVAQVLPWLEAFLAGFLFHVLLHEAPRRTKRSLATGALDVIAALAGALVPMLSVGLQGHDEHGGALVRGELGAAFVEILLHTAPWLLVGLALASGLQVLGVRVPRGFLDGGGAPRQAMRGVVIGAPLPLCACGVLPTAESMRRRGAGPAMVMAFVVAIPQLGLETLTLSVLFLGGPFALVRLAAAVGLAWIAGVAFARTARAASSTARPAPDPLADAGESAILARSSGSAPVLRKLVDVFDELLLHAAPWMGVGLVAAAYVQVAIPAGSLAHARGFDVLVVALVALPTYVSAAGIVPLGAVLVAKGVSPGAVLAGLLLGPATNLATISALARAYGRREVALGVVAIVLACVGIGVAGNAIGVGVRLPSAMTAAHLHDAFAWGSVIDRKSVV